jgi:hypothetical protein
MTHPTHITESHVAAMLAAHNIRPAAMFRGEPARKPRKPRRTSLGTLLKQAADAGKSVKGAEVYRDRTVLQFGEPEAAAPENPWLVEIEKATKQ